MVYINLNVYMKKKKFNNFIIIFEVYVTKKALITGITGQDGAYLAKLLL